MKLIQSHKKDIFPINEGTGCISSTQNKSEEQTNAVDEDLHDGDYDRGCKNVNKTASVVSSHFSNAQPIIALAEAVLPPKSGAEQPGLTFSGTVPCEDQNARESDKPSGIGNATNEQIGFNSTDSSTISRHATPGDGKAAPCRDCGGVKQQREDTTALVARGRDTPEEESTGREFRVASKTINSAKIVQLNGKNLRRTCNESPQRTSMEEYAEKQTLKSEIGGEANKDNPRDCLNYEWIRERGSLEVLGSAPARNSSLKKKLSIINRLKNISNENIENIILELKFENLQKFYSEIVNSLLSNHKIVNHDEIHKIVKILYLLSGDFIFVDVATSTLRKQVDTSWVCGCIYIEMYYMINGDKNLEAVGKYLTRKYREDAILFLHYLLSNFDMPAPGAFRDIAVSLAKEQSQKSLPALSAVASIVGCVDEVRPKDVFVDVVKLMKNEFLFYTKESSTYSHGFSVSDIRKIDTHLFNVDFLDHIARNVSNNCELIEKVLKKKKKISLIPAIARIISKIPRERKEIIGEILSSDSHSTEDLVLLSELYKFNCVKPVDMLSLINTLFNTRQLDKLATILSFSGRFMLAQKETNYSMRVLIEKLKKIPLRDTDKLVFCDCLSKIFKSDYYEVDISEFVQWLFKTRNFNEGGVFSVFRKSKRLLCILFMQPGFFENHQMLGKLIKETNMADTMLSLYLDTLVDSYGHSKQMFYSIIDVIGMLASTLPVERQRSVLNCVLDQRIGCIPKYSSVLRLLDSMSRLLHKEYLDIVYNSGKKENDIRMEYFNFCERHGYSSSANTVCEIDSFEMEMIELMGCEDSA